MSGLLSEFEELVVLYEDASYGGYEAASAAWAALVDKLHSILTVRDTSTHPTTPEHAVSYFEQSLPMYKAPIAVKLRSRGNE